MLNKTKLSIHLSLVSRSQCNCISGTLSCSLQIHFIFLIYWHGKICPLRSWVLQQAALEMSKVKVYNIRIKTLTCCLCCWTSINAGVTQFSGEKGPWLACRRILSDWDLFLPWNSLLVSLAVTSPGSVFSVLGLLIGAVSWGMDQYGANLLGCLVMAATEVLKSTNKNTQRCIRRNDKLQQMCYASLAMMTGGFTAEFCLCCPVTSTELTPLVRNHTGILQLAF